MSIKMFRRVEEGVNPDLEIGRYMAEQSDYHGASTVAGSVEYRRRGAASRYTLGVLHRYIPNQGTAWQYMLDQLSQYFERVAASSREPATDPPRQVLLRDPIDDPRTRVPGRS